MVSLLVALGGKVLLAYAHWLAWVMAGRAVAALPNPAVPAAGPPGCCARPTGA